MGTFYQASANVIFVSSSLLKTSTPTVVREHIKCFSKPSINLRTSIFLLSTPSTYSYVLRTNVALQIKFIHFNIINSCTFARCAEHFQTCIVTNCSLWSLISALVAATSKIGGCPCTAPTGTDGAFSRGNANASSHRIQVGRLRQFSTTNTNTNAFVVSTLFVWSFHATVTSHHLLHTYWAIRIIFFFGFNFL